MGDVFNIILQNSIFTILGIILLVVGFLLLASAREEYKLLTVEGSKVDATVLQCDYRLTKSTKRRRSYYAVTFSYNDSFGQQHFVIGTDEGSGRMEPGSTVQLYVNPALKETGYRKPRRVFKGLFFYFLFGIAFLMPMIIQLINL